MVSFDGMDSKGPKDINKIYIFHLEKFNSNKNNLTLKLL
jgi:hypothetical protein